MGSRAERFPRAGRLTEPAQFQRVFKNSRRRSADAVMTVLACENGLATPRLGMAISRKAARHSVDRNRIKRLIRESFRHQQNLPGLDIVVIARLGIAEKPNVALRRALDRHWEHLSKT